MSKEKIMELVEHTANHLGVISKGSLETFANQVRLETIKEVEDTLPKCKIPNLGTKWEYHANGFNDCLNQIKASLNKLK